MEIDCPDCGGEIELENMGSQKEFVCQDCGLVVGREETVAENAEPVEPEGEVME
jgi:transcription initiation factor TFIIIB Brf1 subunit/transcription initiation factor TFIIB